MASLACGVVLYAAHLKSTARTILQDVSHLVVGRSTLQDVKTLAAKYQSRVSTETGLSVPRSNSQPWLPAARHGGPNSCNSEWCQINIRVKNDKLAAIRLVSPAEFEVSLLVVNDRLEVVAVYLFSGKGRQTGAITQYLYNLGNNPFTQGADYVLWSTGPNVLTAFVNTQTSAKYRERAFDFDMRCLAHVGNDCQSPGDYLPLAWQDWLATGKARGPFLGEVARVE